MKEVYREEADDASEDFKGLAMLNIRPANDSNFIRCLPELEKEIGEKPAKLLLQLEFWIRTSTTDEIEGKRWTYQSTPDIQAKAFASWSQSTINRVIKKLEALELIVIAKFNKRKYDKTRWFALNPAGIGRLKSIILVADDLRSTQNDLGSNQNDLRSTQNDVRSNQIGGTIPETPTEITSETPTEEDSAPIGTGTASTELTPPTTEEKKDAIQQAEEHVNAVAPVEDETPELSDHEKIVTIIDAYYTLTKSVKRTMYKNTANRAEALALYEAGIRPGHIGLYLKRNKTEDGYWKGKNVPWNTLCSEIVDHFEQRPVPVIIAPAVPIEPPKPRTYHADGMSEDEFDALLEAAAKARTF